MEKDYQSKRESVTARNATMSNPQQQQQSQHPLIVQPGVSPMMVSGLPVATFVANGGGASLAQQQALGTSLASQQLDAMLLPQIPGLQTSTPLASQISSTTMLGPRLMAGLGQPMALPQQVAAPLPVRVVDQRSGYRDYSRVPIAALPPPPKEDSFPMKLYKILSDPSCAHAHSMNPALSRSNSRQQVEPTYFLSTGPKATRD